MRPKKLLCLCDSPALETGFGRVAQQLLPRWQRSGYFSEIWLCGIGYYGYPMSDYPWLRAFPAGSKGHPVWWEQPNLQRFVNQANRADADGNFTHVWMMHDAHSLRPLAEPFLEMRKSPVAPATFGYFPVDCDPQVDWLKIVEACDCPVTYTQQGRDAYVSAFTRKLTALRTPAPSIDRLTGELRQRIGVVPHGIDIETFRPLTHDERMDEREKLFEGLVKPDDFLLVNVNAHQKRKGLFQSLQILSHLRAIAPDRPWKLYFHCPSKNASEGTDLPEMARALGLPVDVVFYGDAFFTGLVPKAPEEKLNRIYNAADLVLTTTHGEGWGLTVTEAMAAGRPIASPFHTSLGEILSSFTAIDLPYHRQAIVLPGDNSRPRPVVDAAAAAERILSFVHHGSLADLGVAAREVASQPHYRWDAIAAQWLGLFEKFAKPV